MVASDLDKLEMVKLLLFLNQTDVNLKNKVRWLIDLLVADCNDAFF